VKVKSFTPIRNKLVERSVGTDVESRSYLVVSIMPDGERRVGRASGVIDVDLRRDFVRVSEISADAGAKAVEIYRTGCTASALGFYRVGCVSAKDSVFVDKNIACFGDKLIL
tara:strand:+ start:2549 stop:2884 length:336 start_codon:yes stop_codon:yes gene_type:complete